MNFAFWKGAELIGWLSDEIVNKVRALAQKVCQTESCRLYDIELSGGGGRRCLRVFALAQKGTINLDRCTQISRQLSWLLDTQEIIPLGPYDLEVSSPGLDRRLRKPWHFQEAVGEHVKFTLLRPLDASHLVHGPDGPANDPKGEKVVRRIQSARHIQGLMTEIRDDRVLVEINKICWEVFFSNIQKAQVIFDFKKDPLYVWEKRKKRQL